MSLIVFLQPPPTNEAQDGGAVLGGDTAVCVQGKELGAETAALRRSSAHCELGRHPLPHPHHLWPSSPEV